MKLLGHFDSGFLSSYLFVGIGFSFFGWGGERLWYATIANFFKEPLHWYAVLSHVPLWGLFGGMGYTIALLVSKKFFFFPVDEIPVKNIFFTGATIGTFIQFVLYVLDIQINHKGHKELFTKNTELIHHS